MAKPPAPAYRKVSVNVTDAQHEALVDMAHKMGEGIPIAEVIRKSLILSRIIIDYYAEHPEAPEVLHFGDHVSTPLVIPVRAMLELRPPQST
jgi:hypothetical protein